MARAPIHADDFCGPAPAPSLGISDPENCPRSRCSERGATLWHESSVPPLSGVPDESSYALTNRQAALSIAERPLRPRRSASALTEMPRPQVRPQRPPCPGDRSSCTRSGSSAGSHDARFDQSNTQPADGPRADRLGLAPRRPYRSPSAIRRAANPLAARTDRSARLTHGTADGATTGAVAIHPLRGWASARSAAPASRHGSREACR